MSASAIIPAPGADGLQLSIEKALALVNESRDLRELKDIRDQAGLLSGLARSRDASRDVQNGAGELKLRAERKIGEILDEQKAAGARAAGGKANLRRGASPATQAESPGDEHPPAPPAPTLEQLGIDKNLARRTQAIAKMPETKFETYIAAQKADPAGEITTAGALKVAKSKNPHAASRVNDGDPQKNIRFTDPDWAQELHARFRFTVDAFGQGDAPLSKLVGRWYTKQEDGFAQDYTDERVVANPEWPELPEAGHLAHVQAEAGCELFVLIMPVTQLSRVWCITFVEPYRPDRGGSGVRLEMPLGRKNYGNPDDPECEDQENKGIGMPSCIVVWEGERRRSPDFPELVDCSCMHLHSEGLPCWCCSCKVGVDATAALTRRTSGGARRALVDAIRRVALDGDRRRTLEAAEKLVGALPAGERAALARVGINALVDEATGYQGLRPKDDLRRMLKKERAKAKPPDLGTLLTLDQFRGELVDLGFSLSKRSGASPAVAVRCTHKGCEEAFRVPFSKGTGVDRAELKRLRQHSRSHAGAKTKKRGKR